MPPSNFFTSQKFRYISSFLFGVAWIFLIWIIGNAFFQFILGAKHKKEHSWTIAKDFFKFIFDPDKIVSTSHPFGVYVAEPIWISMLVVSFAGGIIMSLILKHGFVVFSGRIALLIICGMFIWALLSAINHLHLYSSPEKLKALGDGGVIEAIEHVLLGGMVVLILLPILFSRQVQNLFPRVSKVQLPGGVGVEIDKEQIDKQDQIMVSGTQWRRSIGNFEVLMKRLCKLIDETPPFETVIFLAYTPAIGFLARPESEWNELYTRLLRNPNIQFTCLKKDLLKKWHRLFIGEKTARAPDGISLNLADEASRVSQGILLDKDPVNVRVKPIEKEWNELPGLYLFSNKSRAIVVTPFVPQLGGEISEKKSKSDSEVPTAEMIGFETIDQMTVMIVRQLCERYRIRERPNLSLGARFVPTIFSDFVGHEDIRYKGKTLQDIVKEGELTSLLLWGPSGSGKSVLAKVIAAEAGAEFVSFKSDDEEDFNHIIMEAEKRKSITNQDTIVLIKNMQKPFKGKEDQRRIILNPVIKKGIILILAMDVDLQAPTPLSEFEQQIHEGLLKELKMVKVKRLDESLMKKLVYRALYDSDRGLGQFNISLSQKDRHELRKLISRCKGDARLVLDELEEAVKKSASTGKSLGVMLEVRNRHGTHKFGMVVKRVRTFVMENSKNN